MAFYERIFGELQPNSSDEAPCIARGMRIVKHQRTLT